MIVNNITILMIDNAHTIYSRASKPLQTNSNKVFNFSGLGAVRLPISKRFSSESNDGQEANIYTYNMKK